MLQQLKEVQPWLITKDEDHSLEDATDVVLLTTHLMLQQLKEVQPCLITKEVEKATKVARETYEAQLQQFKTKNAALKVNMNTMLSEYEVRLKHAKEKYAHPQN